MKNLIKISDLNKSQINKILKRAAEFKSGKSSKILKNKIIASLFFEPSTRTRLSFEAAVYKLYGNVIGFSDSNNTSLKKGESLEDTLKIISGYVDLIIMRHSHSNSVEKVSKIINKPIINAGDGVNEHPSQTLIDLFAILQTQKKLDNLNIAIVGDLKYGRVPHSLIQALKLFKNKIYLVSPKLLKMPKKYLKNIDYTETENLNKIIPKLDMICMTRIQKERFKNIKDYNKIKSSYILKVEDLKSAKNNLKIIHPLPRLDEIALDIDDTKYAYYFQAAADGIFVRIAILEYICN